MSIADSSIDIQIGQRVRQLRASRNLTLEDLAQSAKVSRAMLSRIERGESSPTAQLLGKICVGLDVTLSALFAEAATPARPLSRRDDQPTWRDPATHYLRRSVSPLGTGSTVDIIEVEFPPGGRVAFDAQRLAGTDQQVWVLEGTLEMSLGDEVFRLDPGDCLWMRFDRPIQFHNPTERPIRYAVIIAQGAPRS
ncbi:helix-turn-helix domain-containing protein [Lichenihabitans sp. PAMC28606]|uniref:helix-turn-helix domain-containing protein n=1 Tax=Lichenihabitans sp. PAMC28606 TaxID=2880932 RepID=UPI001D0B5257|nr:helix-turn-helix domain-containing protein [Lichenihabitans sp. PAMC28606]UDL96353.1 helix-turn-helix domain-containing protein [Lichenihabitans sp. PAMC28606]